MENGMKQKERTGDVLDCILGRKDPSILNKEQKEVILVDSSDSEEKPEHTARDKKPIYKSLHTVREHPPKKKRSPYTKFSDKSGSGKILDDSISQPMTTGGRQYIDEYHSVPNNNLKPKRITPSHILHKAKAESQRPNKNGNEIIMDSDEDAVGLKSNTFRSENRFEATKCTVSNVKKYNPNIKSLDQTQRLQKELMNMTRDSPKEIVLDPSTLEGKNLTTWKMQLSGPKGCSYYGDRFNLQFKFNSKYPQEAPEVTFIGSNIPKLPQVKPNGQIVMGKLGKEWSSTYSVKTICLSIISMFFNYIN